MQTNFLCVSLVPGADPGFRRGGFRTGISEADPNCCKVLGKSTSKQKLQTAVVGGGGGSEHPQKTLYPRMSALVVLNIYINISMGKQILINITEESNIVKLIINVWVVCLFHPAGTRRPHNVLWTLY